MRDVYIIGAHSTAFGRFDDVSFKELTRRVHSGVLADARDDLAHEVDSVWFSNFGMHAVGQASIRGQVCLEPLIAEGQLPTFTPIINVENACASGSSAVLGAYREIASGAAECVLAIGIEKLHHPVVSAFDVLAHGIDMLEPERWQRYYAREAGRNGERFETGGDRSMFMDTYGAQARHHMRRHGTTPRQIAVAAAKSHTFGAANERAHVRRAMTPEQVLDDRMVGESRLVV